MSSFWTFVSVSIISSIPNVIAKNSIALCRGIHEPGKSAYGFSGGTYSAYPELTDDNIIIPSQTYAFDSCNFDISRYPTKYSWKYQCCGNNDTVCMEIFEGTQECITGTDITVHSYNFTDTERTFNCDPSAADCGLSYDWYHNCNSTGGCDLCYNYASVSLVSGGCAKDYTSWSGFQGIYVSSRCRYDNPDYFLTGFFTDDRCTVSTPGPEGGYSAVTLDVCGTGGGGGPPGPGIKNYQCNDRLTTAVPSFDPTTEPTTVEPTTAPITMDPTAAPTTVEPTNGPTTMMPTAAPTTVEPTTDMPTTPVPTTAEPTAYPIVASTTEESKECDEDEDCDDGESCKYTSLSCVLTTDCTGVCVEDDGYCGEEDKGSKWGSWYHLLNDPEQCKLCYCKEKGARHCAKIYDLASDKDQWQERVAETCPFTQYPNLDRDGKQCAFDDLWIEEPVTECSCDILICAPERSISNKMGLVVVFGVVIVFGIV